MEYGLGAWSMGLGSVQLQDTLWNQRSDGVIGVLAKRGRYAL